MKKFICLFLAAFFLFITPVKSLAASPIVFGMTEEIIFPFLASLLGLQAKEQITSLSDLKSYNIELKTGLENKLGYDIAGSSLAQEWVLNAVKGIIETDSSIWRAFRDLVIDNYTVASGNCNVNSTTINNVSIPSFQYYSANRFILASSDYSFYQYDISGFKSCMCYGYIDQWNNVNYTVVCASDSFFNSSNEYTINGQSVYYWTGAGQTFTSRIFSPSYIVDENLTISTRNNTNYIAWAMIYEGIESVANIGAYSDAFADVLTSQEKEDIIDGTSVIQLYNPADEQNGLHFVPDPEDPEDIKIPFAITADWWNYLQQFGSGDNSNQYVNAYNALNGLDQNTSTGRISNAYESLGIASLISSAADALQGIASLTDTNIYPAGQTVSQAINNTVPSSLTPVAPDSGITNDSEQGLYKLLNQSGLEVIKSSIV